MKTIYLLRVEIDDVDLADDSILGVYDCVDKGKEAEKFLESEGAKGIFLERWEGVNPKLSEVIIAAHGLGLLDSDEEE